MSSYQPTVRVVILAAGKGTRMKSDLPKVLMPVAGKPILEHLLGSVRTSGLDPNPVIVVGYKSEEVCRAFGETCAYAFQEKALGTGHAVLSAKQVVGESKMVIVLYGDHPLISAAALQKLTERHTERGNDITLMTTVVPDFEGWHRAFQYWGRILRGSNGHILGIREYKDATETERAIHEVNPALFCFDAKWLWKNIERLGTKNAQGEYYLTDLVELAVSEGAKLSSIIVPAEEVIGINTLEELEIAEALLKQRA